MEQWLTETQWFKKVVEVLLLGNELFPFGNWLSMNQSHKFANYVLGDAWAAWQCMLQTKGHRPRGLQCNAMLTKAAIPNIMNQLGQHKWEYWPTLQRPFHKTQCLLHVSV
jgi:hypothetical protein